MSLKQQVVKGVSWNFLDQVIRQVVSIGVTAVLARILSPNDYGLVALSSIFVGFVSLFESLSIGSALIQRSDLDDRYISTSFWTSVFTGGALAIVLCIIAPFAAGYFDKPLLINIIDISAINLIVSPVGSTHRMLLARKLEFGKLTFINIIFAIIGGIASLILALSGLGVWSLVLGGLIASALIIPLLWYFEEWRHGFIFDRNCFRELFSFSSYLLSSNVVFYFARNFDNLIVGKYLGANMLGIYSMAYNLMMKPLQQISWSITSVLFPAFSSIQGDLARIRSAYLKALSGIALITFPMMMGLMMVSEEFVLVMVGPKWQGVVLPLKVLCPVGALQSIGTTVGAIFNSLGRTDLQFKTGVITSLGHVIGFIICIRWGLMGLVKGYLVTNIIFVSYSLFFTFRLIHLSTREFLQVLKMPAINTAIMVLALMVYRRLDASFMHFSIYLNLAISVCLGVFIYTAATLIFTDRKQIDELKTMVGLRMKTVDNCVEERDIRGQS
ncbi:MAG: MOP flippase family protein [Desulfuromonadaceae bacterium]